MARPVKVLIVEHERLTAKSLKLDLEDMGYDVLDPLAKGEDAVAIATQEDPDLIFMDIRLGGELDGIETAEKIMVTKEIPVIFISGYATNQIKERVSRVNPAGFLEKPVGISQIKELLKKM